MYYRAYVLNKEGHFSGFRELLCSNDEDAKQQALQLLNGEEVELWQEGRQVFVLKPQKDSVCVRDDDRAPVTAYASNASVSFPLPKTD